VTKRRRVIAIARLFLFTADAACAASNSTTASAATARGTPAATSLLGPHIHLCFDPNAGVDQAWARRWNEGLARAIYDFSPVYPVEVRPRSMTTDNSLECLRSAGFDCGGAEGHVYCQSDVIARLLLASALLSASSTLMVLNDDPHLAWQPIDARVALTLAKSKSVGGKVPDWIERSAGAADSPVSQHIAKAIRLADAVGQVYNRPADQPMPRPENMAENIAGLLYKTSAWTLLSFVIGHELTHAHGHCLVQEPSSVELDGSWTRFNALQAPSGPLCGALALNPSELVADRCALRVMSLTDGMLARSLKHALTPAGSAPDNSALMLPIQLSHRIAIDLFAHLAHEGLARQSQAVTFEDSGPVAWYLPVEHNGYLAEALRVYLFASVLHGKAHSDTSYISKLCEASALTFVFGIESAWTKCADRNATPDRVAGGPAATMAMATLLSSTFSDYLAAAATQRWSNGQAWSGTGEGIQTTVVRCEPGE
jgi:hypothetical protein